MFESNILYNYHPYFFNKEFVNNYNNDMNEFYMYADSVIRDRLITDFNKTSDTKVIMDTEILGDADESNNS